MKGNYDLALEQAMAVEAMENWARYSALSVSLEDFETTPCRTIVEAACQAWEADGASGMGPVMVALGRMNKLDAVGGRQGVMALVADSGVPDVDRFRELAKLRRLEAALAHASGVARRGDLAETLDAIGALHSSATDAGAFGDVKTAYELAYGVIEGFQESTRRAPRIHPGLPMLADAIGTLPVGSVMVVAANTSVGKSSFVLEMLMACAQRNVGAGLVSVEDPEEITGTRLLGTVSGVSSNRLQRCDFTEQDWARVVTAMGPIQDLGDRLLFADVTGGNELDVCAAMTRMSMRGARIIAVDYIGEIESSRRQQDRRNEIRWLLKRLKAHAKRLGVALVIVSQLARPKDKNPNQEPSKHDLKEAGDLENSAEVIVGLWREVEHDFAPVRVKILKSKIGGLGISWLMQREKYTARGELGSARLMEVEHEEREWYGK